MTCSGGQTVVFAQSSDGVVFSPAWNDRHFTWTDNNPEGPFPHVTNETTREKIAGTQYDSNDAFETDLYGGMIGIGKFKPINWVSHDHLLALNTDAYCDILEEHDVIERSEDRLWIGFESLEAYLEHLIEDENELVKFLGRVYNPVSIEEAAESDDRLFFTPELERFVLQRPDGYVIEFSMKHPGNIFERIRSVRMFDVMFQMFEDSELSPLT